MHNPQRTVEPTTEPVTVAEARGHLRISHHLDDTYLEEVLIPAAREESEAICAKAWLTQTWVLKLDCFPCWEILLPRPPLQSVSSITYLDTLGASQTLSSSLYRVVTGREPGMIEPAYGQSWPDVYPVKHAVTITYVAGYSSVDALPKRLKPALLQMISHWYHNRESHSPETIREVPHSSLRLLKRLALGHYPGMYQLD